MKTQIAEGVEAVTVGPNSWTVYVDGERVGAVWSIDNPRRFAGYARATLTYQDGSVLRPKYETMEDAARAVATAWRLTKGEA